MKIEIISPDESLLNGEITSGIFPGAEGEFGLLKDHAQITATLKKGVIQLTNVNGEKSTFEVESGILNMKDNQIIVLVDE